METGHMLQGVGSDPRDRKFNIQIQSERYDPNQAYRHLWLHPTLILGGLAENKFTLTLYIKITRWTTRVNRVSFEYKKAANH